MLISGLDPVLLAFPFVMVVIGTVFQTATGAGLGLVASPALLFFFDAPTAVQVATALNLILSVVVLPFEWRQGDRRAIVAMTVWAALGIPFGLWILFNLPGSALRLLCGVLICLSVLQLQFARNKRVPSGGRHARLTMPSGALVSDLSTCGTDLRI